MSTSGLDGSSSRNKPKIETEPRIATEHHDVDECVIKKNNPECHETLGVLNISEEAGVIAYSAAAKRFLEENDPTDKYQAREIEMKYHDQPSGASSASTVKVQVPPFHTP